jgi:hypothetical protein
MPQMDHQPPALGVVQAKQDDGWRQFREAITALSMLSLILSLGEGFAGLAAFDDFDRGFAVLFEGIRSRAGQPPF